MNVKRTQTVSVGGTETASAIVSSILHSVEDFARGVRAGNLQKPRAFADAVLGGNDVSDLEGYADACIAPYEDMEGMAAEHGAVDAARGVIVNTLKRMSGLRDRGGASPAVMADYLGVEPGEMDLESAGYGFGWGSVSNMSHVTGPVIAATLPTSFASQIYPVVNMDQPRTTFEITINTVHHANGMVIRAEDLGYYDGNLGAFGENEEVAITKVSSLNGEEVVEVEAAAAAAGAKFTYIKANQKFNLVTAAGQALNTIPRMTVDPATLMVGGIVYKDTDDKITMKPVNIRSSVDFSDSRAVNHTGNVEIKLKNGETITVMVTLNVSDIDLGDAVCALVPLGTSLSWDSGAKTCELLGVVPKYTFRNNNNKDTMTRMKRYETKEELRIRSAPLVNIPYDPQVDEDSKAMGYDPVASMIDQAKKHFSQALERRSIEFIQKVVAAGPGSGIFSEGKGVGGSKDFVYTDVIDLTPPANSLATGDSLPQWARNYFNDSMKMVHARAQETTRARDVTWFYVTDIVTTAMLPGDRAEVVSGPRLKGEKVSVEKQGIKLWKSASGQDAYYLVGSDFLSNNVNLHAQDIKNTLRGDKDAAEFHDMNNGVLFGVAVPNSKVGDAEKTMEYITYAVNMVEGVVNPMDGMNQAINIYNRDMFVNFRPIVSRILVKGIDAKTRYNAK
jgi:hypothetical protein